MDDFLNYIERYFRVLWNELGDIASQLDGNGWIVISGLLLVCGWFWLKGTKI